MEEDETAAPHPISLVGADRKVAEAAGGADLSLKATRKRKSAKTAKEAKITSGSWTFPKNGLEDALRVPKAVDEKFAGNPTSASELVRAVGFSKENDWRYFDLLRSSSLYGLTSGTGVTARVSLLKPAEDILSPGNPEQRQPALLSAFRVMLRRELE